jgi:hypothetical protein
MHNNKVVIFVKRVERNITGEQLPGNASFVLLSLRIVAHTQVELP